jgi:hypothetical protein
MRSSIGVRYVVVIYLFNAKWNVPTTGDRVTALNTPSYPHPLQLLHIVPAYHHARNNPGSRTHKAVQNTVCVHAVTTSVGLPSPHERGVARELRSVRAAHVASRATGCSGTGGIEPSAVLREGSLTDGCSCCGRVGSGQVAYPNRDNHACDCLVELWGLTGVGLFLLGVERAFGRGQW